MEIKGWEREGKKFVPSVDLSLLTLVASLAAGALSLLALSPFVRAPHVMAGDSMPLPLLLTCFNSLKLI